MIGVLVLHGMGGHEGDFDARFREALLAQLPAPQRRQVVWQPVHYNSALQARQEATWGRMHGERLGGPVNRKLRQFLIGAIGDLMTYGNTQIVEARRPYLAVHRVVRDAVRDLYRQIPAGRRQSTPVLVFAQSMGCQVFSNYLWDVQRGRGLWQDETLEEFDGVPTLRCLVTTGCSIPLLVSGLSPNETRAFNRPAPGFRWINYFDPDDPLGWPLKPLSSGFANSYDAMVNRDEPINVGAAQGSHLKYWADRQFVKEAARLVQEVQSAGV